MTTTTTTTAKSDIDRLEIHVLGGTKGESIVLRLPNAKWGVVDCYAKSLKDPSSNATLKFLADRGVSELEFVCLTHPHDDHFRGMSQILAEFRVHSFWRFGGLSGKHFHKLVHYYQMEAHRGGTAEVKENANEFETIFGIVRNRRRDPAPERHMAEEMVTSRQQLYPVPLDTNAEFQIWGLAPSGDRIGNYNDGFLKCFRGEKVVGQFPYEDHNIISVALLVQYGTTRVILGGDVANAGWDDVLRDFTADKLASHVIKVSHHGSSTSYTDCVWRLFAANSLSIAVVTPFWRHRLPDRGILDKIRSFAQETLTTCLPAVFPPSRVLPLSVNASIGSRRAVANEMGMQPEPTIPHPGRCSFVFDNSGHCVEKKCEEPAGIVTT